ncbi:MAG: TetR/AcrR family transcriptional regulator [Rhodospirillales bacterium]|jgi:AcrR family transcriptional regulator|nr:TetR/AcrR family transcriptional regulator [Rhodospirillales bacterium]
MSQRAARKTALATHKKSFILEAAQRVFAEHGLEGATMRAIALEAGYTAGAIYFHYASKEEIYADLLGHSLERLHEAVARAGGRDAKARLRSAALAFFDFYADNPRDLDLGFYLVHGMRPAGLTPALNRALNDKLLAALAPMTRALVELRLDAEDARHETAALFGHCVGLLLLRHTRRIRLFDADPRALFETYVARLVKAHA